MGQNPKVDYTQSPVAHEDGHRILNVGLNQDSIPTT